MPLTRMYAHLSSVSSDCCVLLLIHLGDPQVRSEVVRIREESRSDMGARGQPVRRGAPMPGWDS